MPLILKPTTNFTAHFLLTSCCFGNALEVPLKNSSHCHGSYIHKVLKTHIINATSGQDYIGPSCQNLLDPLLRDIRFSEATKYYFSYIQDHKLASKTNSIHLSSICADIQFHKYLL